MLRRNMQIPLSELSNFTEKKLADYSPSTEDSASPRSCQPGVSAKSSIRKDKEKSQLCKKYL
jgi:hypothetical protein